MTTASLLFDRCTTTSTRGSTQTLNSCKHNPKSALLAASEVSLGHVKGRLANLAQHQLEYAGNVAYVPSKIVEECLH